MQLLWHRQDLRGTDNTALAAATGTPAGGEASSAVDPVVAAFVLDEEPLSWAGPPRVAFLLDALDALRSWYRTRGSELLVLRGEPATALPALVETLGATAVHWNEDYTGYARRRDERVRRTLEAADVAVERHHDAYCVPPGEITTTAGESYAAFRYFGEAWREREKPVPRPAPDRDALAATGAVRAAAEENEVPIPTPPELGVDDPTASVPPAGADAASERLVAFCDAAIFDYDEERDDPAADRTSRLSPHLALGTIGIREVYAATEDAMTAAETAGDREGVEEFRRQLAWRAFYGQVLAAAPETVSESYQSFERPIAWRDDPEGLAAWKAGETGFPLVDAGMRQLASEAWLHNRVRMVVASFLTKDLLIDWRAGYRWFRERLVDHDTANDVGGWQWAASTGADAQPYFRVFNPATQAERFDPDGTYVERYVPELEGVPAEAIHEWPSLDADRRRELAPAYPDPIVEHAAARERAIAAFERARSDD